MTSLPWWCPSRGLPLWHSRAGEDVFGSTETKGLACWVGLLLGHFWRCCADPWPFLTAPHYFHSEKVSSQQDQTQLPTRGTCRDVEQGSPHLLISNIQVPVGTSKARVEECLQLLLPSYGTAHMGQQWAVIQEQQQWGRELKPQQNPAERSSVLCLCYRIFAFEG